MGELQNRNIHDGAMAPEHANRSRTQCKRSVDGPQSPHDHKTCRNFLQFLVFAGIAGYLVFLYVSDQLSSAKRYKTRNARTRSKPRQQTQAVRQASKRRQFSQLAEQRRHLPAIVYVVQKGDIHKVGISSTAAKTDRVREHEINGWTLRQQWTVPTYDEARAIELKVLRYWRKQLQLRPVKVDMPQGGQTKPRPVSGRIRKHTSAPCTKVSRARLSHQSATSSSMKHTPGSSRVRASDQTSAQNADSHSHRATKRFLGVF